MVLLRPIGGYVRHTELHVLNRRGSLALSMGRTEDVLGRSGTAKAGFVRRSPCIAARTTAFPFLDSRDRSAVLGTPAPSPAFLPRSLPRVERPRGAVFRRPGVPSGNNAHYRTENAYQFPHAASDIRPRGSFSKRNGSSSPPWRKSRAHCESGLLEPQAQSFAPTLARRRWDVERHRLGRLKGPLFPRATRDERSRSSIRRHARRTVST